MTLLFPLGMIAAASLVVAAVAYLAGTARRRRRLCSLGFVPARRALVAPARAYAALVALALISLAAAQPALPHRSTLDERTDAQVWLLIDTSNSMLARRGQAAPTRLAAARLFAVKLQQQLPQIPLGVAMMTDKVLPLLPPTVDPATFSIVVNKTIKANTPPPVTSGYGMNTTRFDTLTIVPNLNFFGNATKKLVILVSDMETSDFSRRYVETTFKEAGIGLELVRVGSRADRIYLDGHLDTAYDPAVGAAADVRALARSIGVGGRLFSTGSPAEVAAAAEHYLGSGPTAAAGEQHQLLSLSPYLLLAALPFLVFFVSTLFAAEIRTRLMMQKVRKATRSL